MTVGSPSPSFEKTSSFNKEDPPPPIDKKTPFDKKTPSFNKEDTPLNKKDPAFERKFFHFVQNFALLFLLAQSLA